MPDQGHREFLLATIDGARDGLIFDLGENLHADPERARLEIEAYSRLVMLVGGEPVGVDDGMLATLRELAVSIDRMNEYERAVYEHSVLWGALLRVERAATKRGSR